MAAEVFPTAATCGCGAAPAGCLRAPRQSSEAGRCCCAVTEPVCSCPGGLRCCYCLKLLAIILVATETLLVERGAGASTSLGGGHEERCKPGGREQCKRKQNDDAQMQMMCKLSLGQAERCTEMHCASGCAVCVQAKGADHAVANCMAGLQLYVSGNINVSVRARE